MKELHAKSFADFHAALHRLGGRGRVHIFRGVARSTYKLIPSVGRCKPRRSRPRLELEQRILKYFKESAVPYVSYTPQNDLEWLGLAQQHGLATRLLDWSYNPLVAAYFAVNKHFEEDGAVYVFWGGSPPKDAEQSNPFRIKHVRIYRPRYISSRILAQAGIFTVHGSPADPFEHQSMAKITIGASVKPDFKDTLFKYGAGPRHLFPGLDGLAQDLLWRETDMTGTRSWGASA